MAERARFHVIVGQRMPGRSIPVWPGALAPEVPDGSWYAWRLLGRNNRELGRSPRVFPTVADCVTALLTVQSRLAELEPTHVVDPAGMWGWRLELGGLPVVVSARPYYRQREGVYNLQQFLAGAPDAELAPTDGSERSSRTGRKPRPPRPPRPPHPSMPADPDAAEVASATSTGMGDG